MDSNWKIVTFALKRPIMLHKPHPGNIVKEYAMKQVLEDLKEAGFIKEED